MRRSGELLALIAISSCAPASPVESAALPSDGPRCAYEVTFRFDPSLTVAAHGDCRGYSPERLQADPKSVAAARVSTAAGRALEQADGSFGLPPDAQGRFSYEIDLGRMARDAADPDVAYASGSAVVAPASTWLLRPAPERDDVTLRVRVHPPPGADFATGLRRRGDAYELMAHEAPVATYSVFGKFRRAFVSVRGREGMARVDVVTPGGHLAASPRVQASWIGDSVRAVAEFWQGFPVARALVVVLPVGGRSGVLFGKLLPESAPGILLQVGDQTTADDLAADWIAVHELFHLGVPSFDEHGKWFDEGLATYFEPIIRARAGVLDEAGLWRELAPGLLRGAAAAQGAPLRSLRAFQDVYWGGAAACFVADVRARQGVGRGLEHGLRSLLARGGHASEVWDLDDALEVIDAALGLRLMSDIARTRDLPVATLLEQLGVRQRGSAVDLDDDAPLASLRRAILRGG
jgi:hypothetical protein